VKASQETGKFISADKVEGTRVYNTLGDTLGAIHDLMIDKATGKVAYALMSFGGFLGFGNQYHPLPGRF
jgi:sporulation protein YlmC with PRC-barrel domain